MPRTPPANAAPALANEASRDTSRPRAAPDVAPPAAFAPDAPGFPKLGLVCLSSDERVKFRSITRTGYLKLPPRQRAAKLLELYWDNTQRLHVALGYCHRRNIRLYRATSGLYPMSDERIGRRVLESIPATLSSVGRRAARLGIRVVLHPDQFVVLSSESRRTVNTSRKILEKHALWFDLLGLERGAWNLMNIHGGKAGRAEQLVREVERLPEGVRSRLTFENDEYSYSAGEILEICRRTGRPMVFDCHHHVIREKLDSYDHPSVAWFTAAARETWPRPEWQVCHVSNGEVAFRDRYHSESIALMPRAFRDVPWLEVEARGKERAILGLRQHWPARAAPYEGQRLTKPTAAESRAAEAEDCSKE